MNKLIESQRIRSVIQFVFEITAVVTLFTVSIFVEFNYYFEIAIGLLVLFMCINTLFFWRSSFSFQKLRRRTELKSADVIGSDIQEAYNFGKIGLIVTEDDGTIVWINEFLLDQNFDVIDDKIGSLNPHLLDLSKEDFKDESITIQYKNHSYEVKLLKSANLYIFKDVSDYEAVYNYSKNQAPVVGYILIDNFTDISSSTEESKYNDMTSLARKQIVSYAKQYQALSRRLRSDMYMFISSMENFEKMRKDNFSLIDIVRDSFEDGFTLSIGVSYGFPDYNKLSELASNAIDVALSRGGDQAVIAPFSESMVFIGGKTDSKASRNKVKIRTLSQSLLAMIEHASNILVMCHNYADMDAVGAALGIKAIANFAKVDCKIIYEEKNVENKTRRAVRLLYSPDEQKKLFVGFKTASELMTPDTLVVVVDFNNPSQAMEKTIITDKTKLVILDHHRRADNFYKNVVFNGIDPSASSTSELVSEYIFYNPSRIPLDEKSATLMLAGILLDTNHYRMRTDIGTYEASTILKQYGANNEKADDFLKEDYEEYVLKNKIMATATTPFYGILICSGDEEDYIDRTMLALVALEAVSIRGVNASFVIGRADENHVRVSSRSDGTVNCQLLLEKMGGGGHFSSAAGEFENVTINQVRDKLTHVLDEYLAEAKKS